MAQYKTGTVQTTNGSAVVVGTGTSWSTEAQAGDIFAADGDLAVYWIQTVTDDTHITLTGNHDTDQSGVTYSITRDFTANFSFPLLNQGDIDLDILLNEIVAEVDLALQNINGGTY